MADSISEIDSSEEMKNSNNDNISNLNINFPINFKCPISSIDYVNYPLGSMLFANGQTWDVLKPNAPNQFLGLTINGLQWQHLQFSNINGVLSASQGGTGWSFMPEKGLVINSAKEVLDLLPFTQDFNLLASKNSDVEWISFKSLVDEVSKKFKTINISNNVASIHVNNPTLKLTDGIVASGLHLDSNSLNFNLSINTFGLGEHNTNFNGMTLNFDVINNNFNFKINDSKVLTINETGFLENCKLSIDSLQGILPIEKGGLGNINFKRGSLLYCSDNTEISTLSAENSEGYYLKIQNGLPKFAELDKSFLDGNINIPLVLCRAKNDLPPLRFQRASLLENQIEGSMEFDGYNLFLTTANGRKALSYLNSDISGKAFNVTGIVSLKNGGTGTDLEELNSGQLIFKNHNELSGLDSGNYGQFLMSQGQGSLPKWTYVISEVETQNESGLKINRNGAIINISVDQTTNYSWQGKHKFLNDINVNSRIILSSKDKCPINFDVTPVNTAKESGDLWFDGSELFFNNGSKVIPLTQQLDTIEQKQIHFLSLSTGHEILDDKKIRLKVAVPYLPTNKNLASVNWKIKYLQMLTDDPPIFQDANFKLLLNNNNIADLKIPIAATDYIKNDFNSEILSSGQILQLECINTGGSNYWSAFLLIEMI